MEILFGHFVVENLAAEGSPAKASVVVDSLGWWRDWVVVDQGREDEGAYHPSQVQMSSYQQASEAQSAESVAVAVEDSLVVLVERHPVS